MDGVTVRQNQLVGIALGLAATIGAGALALRRGETLERQALDWRFRHANRIRTEPRLLHVDIDDGSLIRIGRWPWDRDKLAGLVRTLHELGASVIALDLILDLPQPERIDLPPRGADPRDREAVRGQLNEQNVVYPDRELADAFRRAGNVFLSTHFTLRFRGQPLPPEHAAIRLLESSPEAAADAVRRAAGVTPEEAEGLWLRARLSLLFREEFGLDEAGAAQRLKARLEAVSRQLPRAKELAAAYRASRFVKEAPDGNWEVFLAQVLPAASPESRSLDVTDLRKAFVVTAEDHAALRRRVGPTPQGLRSHAAEALDLIAPRGVLGDAARGVGFVVFTRDPDGPVRQMPLLAEFDGRLIKQFGFAVACHVLGVRDADLDVTRDGYLEIRGGSDRAPRRVQVDGDGRMVVPWTETGPQWAKGLDVRHVPAATVMAPALDRHAIRENHRAIAHYLDDRVIRAVKGEHAGAYAARAERCAELRRLLQLDRLLGRKDEAEHRQRREECLLLEQELRGEQERAEEEVRRIHRELAGAEPESPEEEALFRRYRRAYEALTERIEPLRAANERLRAKIESDLAALAPLVKDRIVFVGHTATAEGDIAPTPIDPTLPGVIVHSNVAGAFLSGQFIRRPPPAVEAGLILLLGAAVTILTATRGPIMTLVATLALASAYTAVNFFVLFWGLMWWVVWVAPIAAMLAPWAAVTVYRQLTAERQKRFVQGQLAEFTDPALARRIAENPGAAEALQRVENREVTCFFSDLRGFTSIAEQTDSARVQHVLNVYLDRMSEVLFRHEAFVNKFLGDGIMAFFNPNVNPQPEHPRLACEAALAALEALEALKREMAGRDDLFEKLFMRVGLATGVAGVGRFGSQRKADYTVIGDVCNLAARLEPANKVFGTCIMVSGATRDAVRDRYEWRYLAELQVKGKQLTVPVFELVCRKGELADGQGEYISRFEGGVELYKQRRWDEAIVQFTRILARRFDDAGASAYIHACQEMKRFPPDEAEWIGALELKEK